MCDIVLVVQHAADRMPAIAVDFGRIGVFEPHNVPSKFDKSALKPEANAEVRDLAFASITHGLDLAGDAAVAKTTGDENAVPPAQALFRAVALENFCLN